VSGSGRAESARTAPVKNVESESSGATDTKAQQRTGEKKAAQGPCFFLPGEKPGPESNKPFDTGVLRFVFTFSHNFAFNLSLTRRLQTIDRIFRYFKANFSALIR
jgi:hypothetical protein